MNIKHFLIGLGVIAGVFVAEGGSALATEQARSQASKYGPSVLPRTGPEAVNKLALSPDGTRFAASIAMDGGFYVLHANIDGSDPKTLPLIKDAEPHYLSWPQDNALIVGYRRTRMRQRDRSNFQASSEKAFTSIKFARAFNLKTEENWVLNQWDGGFWEVIPSLSRIANMDTSNHTLSVDFGGYVSTFDLQEQRVASVDYDSDYSDIENIVTANGDVRLSVRDANNRLHLRCANQDGKLQHAYSAPIGREGWPLQPVAPGEGEQESYLLERNENGTLSRLVKFDCLSPEGFEIVVDADGAQIEGVFFNVHEQRVYGVWASGEIPAFTYFDDALAAQVEAVSTALGGSVHIWPVDFARDGQSFILYARPMNMKTGVFVHVEERGGQLAVTQLLNEGSLSR